jgi:hypothetical protein
VKQFEPATDLKEYEFKKEPFVVPTKRPSVLAGFLSKRDDKGAVPHNPTSTHQSNIMITIYLPSSGYVKIKVIADFILVFT